MNRNFEIRKKKTFLDNFKRYLNTKFGNPSFIRVQALRWTYKNMAPVWIGILTKEKKNFLDNVRMIINTKFSDTSSICVQVLRWVLKDKAKVIQWPWLLNCNFDKRKKKSFIENLKMNLKTKFGNPNSFCFRTGFLTKKKKKTFLDNFKMNLYTKFGDPSSIRTWALRWTYKNRSPVTQ